MEDHSVYHNNYAQCSEWVATLRKRLQICGDLAGDKHDVEDRLVKLHVGVSCSILTECMKNIQRNEMIFKVFVFVILLKVLMLLH